MQKGRPRGVVTRPTTQGLSMAELDLEAQWYHLRAHATHQQATAENLVWLITTTRDAQLNSARHTVGAQWNFSDWNNNYSSADCKVLGYIQRPVQHIPCPRSSECTDDQALRQQWLAMGEAVVSVASHSHREMQKWFLCRFSPWSLDFFFFFANSAPFLLFIDKVSLN